MMTARLPRKEIGLPSLRSRSRSFAQDRGTSTVPAGGELRDEGGGSRARFWLIFGTHGESVAHFGKNWPVVRGTQRSRTLRFCEIP